MNNMKNEKKPLLLASQSPRRRELMALVTPDFQVAGAGVDEGAVAGSSPADLAGKLAQAKARAAAAQHAGCVVIGCDTVVELGGKTLGKPRNADEAADMLKRMAGRQHQVHTGVCVYVPGGRQLQFVETTTVFFSAIPGEEIAAYVKTPEPYDKAGGYGIQGWAARFVTRVEGCYYNVMGLPVAALYRLLVQNGLL